MTDITIAQIYQQHAMNRRRSGHAEQGFGRPEGMTVNLPRQFTTLATPLMTANGTIKHDVRLVVGSDSYEGPNGTEEIAYLAPAKMREGYGETMMIRDANKGVVISSRAPEGMFTVAPIVSDEFLKGFDFTHIGSLVIARSALSKLEALFPR
jgi:hypothetical protein